MARTTFRSIVFLSFLIPILLIALHLRGERYLPKTRSDTQSYVLSSPYRTVVYPAFLNLLTHEDSQRTGILTSDSIAFSKVTAVQKFLFILSALILFVACHRFIPFSHLALWLLGLLFWRAIGSNLLAQVSWVQPEGLFLSWILLVVAAFIEALNSKRTSTTYFLSILLFVGCVLSPRFFCFSPLISVSFLIFEKWANRLGPVFVFVGLLIAQCTSTYIRSGVFSLSPMNGFYTIANVLRLADVTAVEEFQSPKERTFLMRALMAPDRRTEIKYNDWMTWDFGTRIYRETFPEKFEGLTKGKDVLHMNRFYAKMFPILLLKNPLFRGAWFKAGSSLLWTYIANHKGVNFLMLALALVSLFYLRINAQLILSVPLFCLLIHWVNILYSVPFSGLVSRYTVTSEALVILSCFSMLLFLWDKCAALVLNHFFSFNRRSITLENSEAG